MHSNASCSSRGRDEEAVQCAVMNTTTTEVYLKKDIIFNDIVLITPDIFDDKRGFFSEIYNRKSFEKLGINVDFVQDNFSFSENANTLRGIHFQSPPFAQSKLIRVVSGSIFDIFIDLRK